MPQKPKSECTRPGCHNLTARGACTSCAAAEALEYNRNRPQAERRLFKSARWKKLRAHVLRRSPICESCQRVPATDVDHIVPRAQGGTHATSNLQALCKACHSRKTAREGRWGGAGAISGAAADGIGPLAVRI